MAKEMGTLSERISLSFLQEYIRKKDYKPELKHAYFSKLIEEVGELAEVLSEGRIMEAQNIKGTIEELYDVLYYVLALANVYDVDLEQSFRLKEELNKLKYGHSCVWQVIFS